MEINSITQSPNFGARIRIEKTGFQNLGKDIVDSFELGTRTTGITSSSITESTIFPSDATRNFKFFGKITKHIEYLGEIFNDIFHRNLKTSALEGVDTKAVAEKTASATTGSGLISTGVESYDMAFASALDQSIHYPNSSYPASAAEFIGNHLTQSSAEHMAQRINSVYNQLWDPRGSAGNELASTQSTAWSGSGAISQGLGFDLLTKGKKSLINAEEVQRKIPS